MKLKGKIRVNGRLLDFEFTVNHLSKVLGSSTCWSDDTFSVRSLLVIDGKAIGDEYYNFVDSTIFINRMYQNASCEIDSFELDKEEYAILGENVMEMLIRTPSIYETCSDDDFYYWFLNFYRINQDDDTIKSSVELGEDLFYIVDEYVSTGSNFPLLLNDLYEFANGYHCLSQMNRIIECVCDFIVTEYEEYQDELDEIDKRYIEIV